MAHDPCPFEGITITEEETRVGDRFFSHHITGTYCNGTTRTIVGVANLSGDNMTLFTLTVVADPSTPTPYCRTVTRKHPNATIGQLM